MKKITVYQANRQCSLILVRRYSVLIDLFVAHVFAIEAAQAFTWQAYQSRVGNYIEEWL